MIPNNAPTIKNNPEVNYLNDDLHFLISCCQTDPSGDDIKFIFSYLNAEHLDINALIGLANQHGILPLVYKTIKKIVEDDSSHSSLNATRYTLHAEILTKLKVHYMSISQRNMLMSAELIRIMKLLEANNIEALAFKGPILAQMAYGDITLRQFGDLDILVDEKKIVKAGSVLTEYGYKASYPITILENQTCLRVINDLSFHNDANGTLIELHWRLFREKIGQHLSFTQINETRQSITINAKTLPTFSSEMLLVYLCLHGSKHAWERIEWICDIDRLIRSSTGIDWDLTQKIAQEMDTRITLYLGIKLSHILFHTPLPDQIRSSLHTDRVESLRLKTYYMLNNVFTKNDGYAKYNAIHLYQMDLLDTKFKKIKHLLATYFWISRNDCQELPLPPLLSFLYIFIKPLRVGWKYLRYGK